MAKRVNFKWTSAHQRFIMDNPMKSDRQLAQLLNTTRKAVEKFRSRYGMKKSESFMQLCRTNNKLVGGGRPIKKLFNGRI